jgi:hypothetical protein
MGRLNYLRFNQDQLRADLYQGLIEACNKDDNTDSAFIGQKIILPASFVGGPRYMIQLFHDSMSVVRSLGKPDLFITVTCNPKWIEITIELRDGQDVNDRPDLIARVFCIKVKAIMEDLLNNKIYGTIIGYTYVIEFQKRGLPHAHLLMILDPNDKPKTIEDYDKIVWAFIPDKKIYPQLYETVSTCMMHGPCGKAFPNSPCMEGDRCSKRFPKEYCENTTLNPKG